MDGVRLTPKYNGQARYQNFPKSLAVYIVTFARASGRYSHPPTGGVACKLWRTLGLGRGSMAAAAATRGRAASHQDNSAGDLRQGHLGPAVIIRNSWAEAKK